MAAEAWVAVGIFVLTQFGALAVTVFILKGDTNLLRVQLIDMKDTLRGFQGVLTQLAVQDTRLDNQSERIANFEKRQIAEGARIDEVTQRLNRFVDIKVYPILASEP